MVVLTSLSIAAVGNITKEVLSEPNSRALIAHDGGELAEATATEPSLSRGRYWIASVMRDIASGGELIVRDRSLINPYRFKNLAGVEIVLETYDHDLTPEAVAQLDGLPTAQGLGNITGLFDFTLFRVVWSRDGTPVPVLRLWYFGDMMYLIDERVLTPGSTS